MVPLYESQVDQQLNLIKIKENVTVPPRTTKPVHVGMVFDETNEEKTSCHYELNNLKVTADQDFNPNKNEVIKSNNEVRYLLTKVQSFKPR